MAGEFGESMLCRLSARCGRTLRWMLFLICRRLKSYGSSFATQTDRRSKTHLWHRESRGTARSRVSGPAA